MFLRLEGVAEGLSGAYCVLRTYRDFICGAIGLTIVIVAVLYVALDALDMIAGAIAFILAILFHDAFPFLIDLQKDLPLRSLFFPSHRSIIP